VTRLRAAFEQQYADRLRFVQLTWRGLPDLGIYEACVSKGNTLRAFCQERGIRREEVMAIGDHVSDASMFEAAGLRVAMANADPELKAVADYVTRSNADDGVAVALERFFGPMATLPLVPPG
jgi:hydroxymethylpyrimidine pyrophosphatase-like HAD family hydrolase